MNILLYIMVFFSVLGAIDCILNNRFGIGKEWERGFHLLGTMSHSRSTCMGDGAKEK
jgi:ethanolamine transporter